MHALADQQRIEQGFSPVCDYYFSNRDHAGPRVMTGWELVSKRNRRRDEKFPDSAFADDGRIHSGERNVLLRRENPEKVAAREKAAEEKAAEEKAANQRDEKS